MSLKKKKIKSISLSRSQSKLSCSHILLIRETDEYQNSHDINPNPISPKLPQKLSKQAHTSLIYFSPATCYCGAVTFNISIEEVPELCLRMQLHSFVLYFNLYVLKCLPSLTSQHPLHIEHIIKAGSQTFDEILQYYYISHIYKESVL